MRVENEVDLGPKKGDTREYTTSGPLRIKTRGLVFTVDEGEWVVVKELYTENMNNDIRWCYNDVRPATQEEIDTKLGPIRWWQFSRKRERRLPKARLLEPIGS